MGKGVFAYAIVAGLIGALGVGCDGSKGGTSEERPATTSTATSYLIYTCVASDGLSEACTQILSDRPPGPVITPPRAPVTHSRHKTTPDG